MAKRQTATERTITVMRERRDGIRAACEVQCEAIDHAIKELVAASVGVKRKAAKGKPVTASETRAASRIGTAAPVRLESLADA